MHDDLAPPRHGRPRERFLRTIRETGELDQRRLASAFAGHPLLPGFRAVLHLREHDPRSREQLAALVGEFDPEIHARLATLARELRDHRYYSMQDVIAGRGYRRVHTTALAAGALMMWSAVPGADSRRHWRHGIATGMLASLALDDDVLLSDRAFPTGLLHDLGRLCLSLMERRTWESPALIAETAGRLVASELRLPGWLSDTLFSCELGPRGDTEPEAVVATACAIAAQIGYPSAAPVGPAPRTSDAQQLRGALDREGGREWLESRVEAAELAARGHLVAVFAGP